MLEKTASGLLLLALTYACNDESQPSTPPPPTVVTSTQTLSPDTPQANATPTTSTLDLKALAATRAACLSAPLSPSASELPALEGHVHSVRGEHHEQHVFLPARPSRLSSSSSEVTLTDVSARFPELGGATLRSCESGRETNPGRAPHCLYVEVPLCEAWLPLAQRLLPLLSSKGLGLVVELQGRPAPRCSGDDCLPVPYHDTSNVREDLVRSGWFTLPYRPDAERSRVLAEFGRGQCESDGDCSITGCGNHCEAWYEAPHGATCPAYRDLVDAHCGCVSGTCGWFVQPASYGVTAQIQVEGWVAPSKKEVRKLESGEQVFRQILEGGWLVRQLQYSATRNQANLPSQLGFHLVLDSRFKVVKLNVTSGSDPAPLWVRKIFSYLPVPVPTFGREQSAPRRIIAHGQLVIAKH